MNLLTLTLAALCLVSGSLAAKATLTRSDGDGGQGIITLTCADAGANEAFKKDGAGANLATEAGKTELAGLVYKILVAGIATKKGSYTCQGDTGTTSDPVVVGDPVKPTLESKQDGTKYTLTCKSVSAGSIYEFHNTTAATAVKLTTDPTNGLTITKGVMEIETDKFKYYAGKYTCKAQLDTSNKEESDVTELSSSAPRLLTSGGLALCLCLLVSSFL